MSTPEPHSPEKDETYGYPNSGYTGPLHGIHIDPNVDPLHGIHIDPNVDPLHGIHIDPNIDLGFPHIDPNTGVGHPDVGHGGFLPNTDLEKPYWAKVEQDKN